MRAWTGPVVNVSCCIVFEWGNWGVPFEPSSWVNGLEGNVIAVTKESSSHRTSCSQKHCLPLLLPIKNRSSIKEV